MHVVNEKKKQNSLLYLEALHIPGVKPICICRRFIWKYLSNNVSQIMFFPYVAMLWQKTYDLSLTKIKKFLFGLGYVFDLSNSSASWNTQVHILDAPLLHPPLPGWKLVEFLLGKQK